MCKIADWFVFFLMVACSYSDAKKKTIPIYLLIILSVVVVCVAMLCNTVSMQMRVTGALLGLLFLFVSKCSKEAIGYGDSWLILLLGIQVGCLRAIGVLFLASLLASAISLFFLWRHRWKRSMTLPFVPFLTIAYLGAMVL